MAFGNRAAVLWISADLVGGFVPQIVQGAIRFVAVDEYEVEHTAQSGSYIQRRTDVEPDAGAVRAAVEERLRQLFQFVFNLDGMQFGLPFQPCGHAEGRVTRESPDFEHPPRA